MYKCDNYKLVPRLNGLVKQKGSEEELDLSNYSLGDVYASALSKGI